MPGLKSNAGRGNVAVRIHVLNNQEAAWLVFRHPSVILV